MEEDADRIRPNDSTDEGSPSTNKAPKPIVETPSPDDEDFEDTETETDSDSDSDRDTPLKKSKPLKKDKGKENEDESSSSEDDDSESADSRKPEKRERKLMKRKKKKEKKHNPKKYYTNWEDPEARHREDMEYHKMILEIEPLLHDPEKGVKIGTLRPKYKKIKENHNVFSGRAAGRWFIRNGYAANNKEAQRLGTALLSRRLIYDLDGKKSFSLSRYALYRFYIDDGQTDMRLQHVRVKKDGSIALIAEPDIFNTKKYALAALFGVTQASLVDTIEVDKAFVKHYYAQDEHELTEKDIWAHKKTRSNAEKLELHESVVLHNGDLNDLSPEGKLWMIAYNGTSASRYAFEEMMNLVKPATDFLIIVAIRERPLPDTMTLLARDAPKRVDWEFNLFLTVRHMLIPVRDRLLASKISFIIISPKARHGRNRLVRIAIQYKPNILVMGKHVKGERGVINYPQGRWRSWAPYVEKRCKFTDVRVYSLETGLVTSSFDKMKAKGREVKQVYVPLTETKVYNADSDTLEKWEDAKDTKIKTGEEDEPTTETEGKSKIKTPRKAKPEEEASGADATKRSTPRKPKKKKPNKKKHKKKPQTEAAAVTATTTEDTEDKQPAPSKTAVDNEKWQEEPNPIYGEDESDKKADK